MTQPPSRKITGAEIELFARQAGERARLQAEQANEQIDLGVVVRPKLSEDEIDRLQAAAVAGAELQAAQSNELFDLLATHKKQADTLTAAHRAKGGDA